MQAEAGLLMVLHGPQGGRVYLGSSPPTSSGDGCSETGVIVLSWVAYI